MWINFWKNFVVFIPLNPAGKMTLTKIPYYFQRKVLSCYINFHRATRPETELYEKGII